MPEPILFVLGAAGIGKTTLAELIRSHLNFVHVNLDPEVKPDGWFEDGPAKEGLSQEWHALAFRREPGLFVEKVRGKVRAGGANGACVSCQSFFSPVYCFDAAYLETLKPLGVGHVLLYGPEGACHDAFINRPDGLSREQKNWASWRETNAYWFDLFQPADFAANAIRAFDGQSRRPPDELIAGVRAILERL